MTVEQAKKNLQTVAQECAGPYSAINPSIPNLSNKATNYLDQQKGFTLYFDGREMLNSLSINGDLDTTWLSTVVPSIEKPLLVLSTYHKYILDDINLVPISQRDMLEADVKENDKLVNSFRSICLPSIKNAVDYLRSELNKANSEVDSTTNENEDINAGLGREDSSKEKADVTVEKWGVKFTWGSGNLISGGTAGLAKSLNGDSSIISNGSAGLSSTSITNADVASRVVGNVLGPGGSSLINGIDALTGQRLSRRINSVGSLSSTSTNGKVGGGINSSTSSNNGSVDGGVSSTFDDRNNSGTWYLALLPAMRSTINMQGGMDTPGAGPGLSIKVLPNVVKHKIPGFQSIYQHLGVDTVMISMVGTFTGADGFNPKQYSSDMNWNSMVGGSTDAKGNLLYFKSAYDAYNSFNEFYKIAVLDSNELTVEINMARNKDIMEVSPSSSGMQTNLRDETTGNPKFKGFVRKMEVMHARSDRTWYSIDIEVTDHGMIGDEPVNLTNLVEEALDGAEKAKVEESTTPTNCNDNLIQTITGSNGWKVVDIAGWRGESDLGVDTREQMAYNVSSCQLIIIRKANNNGKLLCGPDSNKVYKGKEAILELIRRHQNSGVDFRNIVSNSSLFTDAINEMLSNGSRIGYTPNTPAFDPYKPVEGVQIIYSLALGLDVKVIGSGRVVNKSGGAYRELPPKEAYTLITDRGRNYRRWEDLKTWLSSSSNVQVCSDATSNSVSATPSTNPRVVGQISSNLDQGPIGFTNTGTSRLYTAIKDYLGKDYYDTSKQYIYLKYQDSNGNQNTLVARKLIGISGPSLKVVPYYNSNTVVNIPLTTLLSVTNPATSEAKTINIWRATR